MAHMYMERKKPGKVRTHNESNQEQLDRPWGGHGKPPVQAELEELLADVDAALEGIDEELATKFVQHNGE